MGMKVVCVNNGPMDGAMESSVNLTLGKAYEVLGDMVSPNDSVFNIINDIGNKGSYYFGRFVTLDEARHEKLEKLGI
jgi:hypothetical protein